MWPWPLNSSPNSLIICSCERSRLAECSCVELSSDSFAVLRETLKGVCTLLVWQRILPCIYFAHANFADSNYGLDGFAVHFQRTFSFFNGCSGRHVLLQQHITRCSGIDLHLNLFTYYLLGSVELLREMAFVTAFTDFIVSNVTETNSSLEEHWYSSTDSTPPPLHTSARWFCFLHALHVFPNAGHFSLLCMMPATVGAVPSIFFGRKIGLELFWLSLCPYGADFFIWWRNIRWWRDSSSAYTFQLFGHGLGRSA